MNKFSIGLLAISATVIALVLPPTHAANGPYVTLIPKEPSLPTIVPQANPYTNWANFFGAIQSQLVSKGVSIAMEAVANSCLADAASTGQRGSLLKVRVGVQQMGMERFLIPIGSGVYCVGSGPSAQGVMYFHGVSVLEEPVPIGMPLDDDLSHYVWIERGKNSEPNTVALYDIRAMDSYVKVVKASVLASQLLMKATAGAFLDSYGQMLTAVAKSDEDRKIVQNILSSRADAAAKLSEVEKDLTVKLDRADRAARIAATWSTLSAVFSVASGVAMATASLGAEPRTAKGSAPATTEELIEALKLQTDAFNAAAAASKTRVESLRAKLQQLQDELLNTGKLRGYGIKESDSRILWPTP